MHPWRNQLVTTVSQKNQKNNDCMIKLMSDYCFEYQTWYLNISYSSFSLLLFRDVSFICRFPLLELDMHTFIMEICIYNEFGFKMR